MSSRRCDLKHGPGPGRFTIGTGLLAGILLAGCRAPDELLVHGLSYHGNPSAGAVDDLGVESPSQLEEVNPGLGLSWELGERARWTTELGAFRNSFGDHAPYGALSWAAGRLDGLELGLVAGAAGYAQGLVPLGGAYLELGASTWAVRPRFTLGPAADVSGYLVTLSLAVDL